MKKTWALIVGATFLSAPLGEGKAQDTAQNDSLPPVAGEDGTRAQDAQREPHRDEGAVFHWMDRLRATHPEEFQRLRRLREDNPEAFRVEIRRRIQKRLPAGRDESGGAATFGGDESRRPHPPIGRIEHDFEAERLQSELLKLARQYHGISDPDEKERIRREIRTRIETVFEQRDAAWTKRIEAARKDLEALERRLEQWRAMRGDIIERRLNAMLADPAVSAPSPRRPDGAGPP